ncbi:hypothetical protein MP638_000534 [Amoeboaphelidium occidentale]|nr:hypothetical protein MP638_000534 [Amoeboaphelidium occidentale]
MSQGPTSAIVESKYIVKKRTTLMMKEGLGSFSGDDFLIIDPYTNKLWFRLDAKVFSFRSQRFLLDGRNAPVLTLEKHLALFIDKWVGFGTSTGHIKFGLNRKLFSFTPMVFASIGGGDNHDIVIRGDLWCRSYEIVDVRTNQLLARCSRQHPLQTSEAFMSTLFNKHNYFVTIEPGVDSAFIVSTCLIVDEMFHESFFDWGFCCLLLTS